MYNLVSYFRCILYDILFHLFALCLRIMVMFLNIVLRSLCYVYSSLTVDHLQVFSIKYYYTSRENRKL